MNFVKEDKKKQLDICRVLFWSILVVGALSRLYKLGVVPGGVHPDEAYAGYEAYSMLHYGTDSWGYHLPVYFVSWGSGMNVLESYLMIPFVALFGLNEFTIRIVQVIFSIASIVYMYLLVDKVANKKLALTAMFIAAISPWHYMYSRWGCESNLCPAMLLIGTYYLILSIDRIINKSKSPVRTMICSAIFFGLDLYCYAATWILVVMILVTWSIYLFVYCKKEHIEIDKKIVQSIVIFIAILFVMALPLVLFILVNLGIIREINSFIAIPKLVVFRNDEVMNFSVLKERLHYFAHILVAQEDGRPWNSISPFGLFYTKISIPVILLGVWSVLVRVRQDFKEKKFSYAFMLFMYSFIAALLVIAQRVDIISSNYLQISILFYWAVGIYFFVRFVKGWLYYGIVAVYSIAFVSFLVVYFGSFKSNINECQLYGTRDAVNEALQRVDNGDADRIVVSDSYSHANILFYSKYEADEYLDTVRWKKYPDRYMSAKSFGIFSWEELDAIDDNTVYIVTEDDIDVFDNDMWEVVRYDYSYVAYRKN